MITKVRKWGNSLALRIPKSFAKEAFIEPNSEVDLALKQGRLVIVPIRRKSLTLKEVLAKVTRKNLHQETGTGRPIGRELL